MSGSWPSDIKTKAVTLSSTQQTLVSQGQSFKRQVRTKNTQRWTIHIDTPPMHRSQWQKLLGFFNKQQGRYGTFTFSPSILSIQLGAGGGTPLVNGGSQTGSAIITDGWPNSTTVLKQGDIFKFANSTKVYQVTDDATTNGSGQVTINICPALITSPADNEAIVYQNVAFTVAFSSDSFQTPIDTEWISEQSFDLEEVL